MEKIYSAIPHRPPFLFVDKIHHIDDSRITTTKHIDKSEQFFLGHYPDYPIMPGVLICEAIFQTGAILLSNSLKEKDSYPVLTQIKKTKFRANVFPGDVLEMEVILKDRVSRAFYLEGRARVLNKLVVYTEFVGTMVKK